MLYYKKCVFKAIEKQMKYEYEKCVFKGTERLLFTFFSYFCNMKNVCSKKVGLCF